MSNSYRTEKESIIAARKIKRNSNGGIVYPRIVIKPPAPGDVHPLTPKYLRILFEKIPIEYLYGLRKIELRSRSNNEIGRPFAHYSGAQKTITLFSLPHEWKFQHPNWDFCMSLLKFHPKIIEEEDSLIVRWKNPKAMSLWFYLDVFTHELGHHFRMQYRHKNGALGRYKDEELVAELHARRFTDAMIKKFRHRHKP